MIKLLPFQQRDGNSYGLFGMGEIREREVREREVEEKD
jgi:hypothetical protein